MFTTIIGKKLGQTQGFLSDGKRIPMTRIDVSSNVVVQIKNSAKEGYDAVQLGFGTDKKADKPTTGHATKAGLKTTPRFFRETKAEKMDSVEVGSAVVIEEVLSAGDIVDVSGISKGKGYAGVVKRHHFKGGPKTHGQSDRHRAPGSIGQSTTPGRVYKGKRMAGRMGAEDVTVKNLEVIDIQDGVLVVKGLVPGHISSIVTITRRGVNKKHMGLFKVEVEAEVVEELKVEEIGPSIEEQEELKAEVVAEAKAEEIAEKEAAQTGGQVEDVKEEVSEPKTEEAAVEEVVEAPVESASEPAVEVAEEEKEAK
jgi:large subunit ribosomal protein L3